MQLLVKKASDAGDLLGRNGRLGGLHLPLKVRDLLGRFVSLELQGDEPFPHLRVVCLHDALLNEFEKLGDVSLGVRVGVAQAGELFLVQIATLGR